MPKLLQIAQLGHPILRKQATKVEDFSDTALQNLIDDMLATLKDAGGVGIAAPQVYESRQLFIVASFPTPRYPNAPKMRPIAMFNPKIIGQSDAKNTDWEGCLSVPGICALVPRHNTIKIEFTARDGKKCVKNFQGFIARIFQHEYDHLKGLTFLDCVETTKDIVTEKEYRRIISQKQRT